VSQVAVEFKPPYELVHDSAENVKSTAITSLQRFVVDESDVAMNNEPDGSVLDEPEAVAASGRAESVPSRRQVTEGIERVNTHTTASLEPSHKEEAQATIMELKKLFRANFTRNATSVIEDNAQEDPGLRFRYTALRVKMDSGSSNNLISRSVVENLDIPLLEIPEEERPTLIGFDGSKFRAQGEVTVTWYFERQLKAWTATFHVVDSTTFSMILGTTILRNEFFPNNAMEVFFVGRRHKSRGMKVLGSMPKLCRRPILTLSPEERKREREKQRKQAQQVQEDEDKEVREATKKREEARAQVAGGNPNSSPDLELGIISISRQ
jgi:hypothetical protein